MTARSTLLFFLITISAAFAEPCPVPVNQSTLAKYCPRISKVKGKTHPDTCNFYIDSPKELRSAKLEVYVSRLTPEKRQRELDRKKVMMAGLLGNHAQVKELAPKGGVAGFLASGSGRYEEGHAPPNYKGEVSVHLESGDTGITLNVDLSLCDEDQAEALARALLAAAPNH